MKKRRMNPASLVELPMETLLRVAEHLDGRSLARLGGTCCRLRDLAGDDAIWKAIVVRLLALPADQITSKPAWRPWREHWRCMALPPRRHTQIRLDTPLPWADWWSVAGNLVVLGTVEEPAAYTVSEANTLELAPTEASFCGQAIRPTTPEVLKEADRRLFNGRLLEVRKHMWDFVKLIWADSGEDVVLQHGPAPQAYVLQPGPVFGRTRMALLRRTVGGSDQWGPSFEYVPRKPEPIELFVWDSSGRLCQHVVRHIDPADGGRDGGDVSLRAVGDDFVVICWSFTIAFWEYYVDVFSTSFNRTTRLFLGQDLAAVETASTDDLLYVKTIEKQDNVRRLYVFNRAAEQLWSADFGPSGSYVDGDNFWPLSDGRLVNWNEKLPQELVVFHV
eukprot:TRINITY_DN4216_c1_g1_i1.p1 TRINITY_DN4216_c1_g1~~TRINITY_DN4216_c1_g1_i1.p1  ORF type:complete len:390 (-),score=101.53 TRINITY_DN4216_c1_g1_i1:42-1211(-)